MWLCAAYEKLEYVLSGNKYHLEAVDQLEKSIFFHPMCTHTQPHCLRWKMPVGKSRWNLWFVCSSLLLHLHQSAFCIIMPTFDWNACAHGKCVCISAALRSRVCEYEELRFINCVAIFANTEPIALCWFGTSGFTSMLWRKKKTFDRCYVIEFGRESIILPFIRFLYPHIGRRCVSAAISSSSSIKSIHLFIDSHQFLFYMVPFDNRNQELKVRPSIEVDTQYAPVPTFLASVNQHNIVINEVFTFCFAPLPTDHCPDRHLFMSKWMNIGRWSFLEAIHVGKISWDRLVPIRLFRFWPFAVWSRTIHLCCLFWSKRSREKIISGPFFAAWHNGNDDFHQN